MGTATVKRSGDRRPRTRPWAGHARRPEERRVVAEVLSDGTVRPVEGPGVPPEDEWAQGQMAGEGWVLWWQRRRLGA